ncbi:unnamed protein product [Brachionus calyciflorus]|uniref:Uncharacterized protein n=1 Tax=Brachionus calyciflorus TaxID=104777 RepID=A0A813TFT3_9BILA|nr:unnamed protein product [Brachionus calyciflorus]
MILNLEDNSSTEMNCDSVQTFQLNRNFTNLDSLISQKSFKSSVKTIPIISNNLGSFVSFSDILDLILKLKYKIQNWHNLSELLIYGFLNIKIGINFKINKNGVKFLLIGFIIVEKIQNGSWYLLGVFDVTLLAETNISSFLEDFLNNILNLQSYSYVGNKIPINTMIETKYKTMCQCLNLTLSECPWCDFGRQPELNEQIYFKPLNQMQNNLEKKYEQALKNFSEFYNSEKKHRKSKYAYPIKSSGLSLNQSRNLGFKISKYMWRNSGRKVLVSKIREMIELHMKSLSSIAANRFLKKCGSNAYYTSVSLSEAFSLFSMKHLMSFSTFYKYVPTKFKKPHRISDLCEYCELNKKYKRDLLNLTIENGVHLAEFDPNNINKFFIENQQLKTPEIEKVLSCIEVFDFHREIANRQRDSYNQMRENLEDDYILIEMDWKQKILIGMSPRQTSNEYRTQVSRTLLGFGVYYKKNGKTEVLNIDLISSQQENETSFDVLCGFRFLRQLEEFKEIEQNKYLIWADTGSHFRSAEILSYLFVELSNEKIQVCLNFFCEKHGKNGRDQHFSVVGNFLKQESLVKKLTCSEDIANAIDKHQKLSNIRRDNLRLPPVLTKAYVLRKENIISQIRSFRFVKNIRCYYNFFTDKNFTMKSTILSDLRNSIEIKYKDNKESRTTDESFEGQKIQKLEVNINYISKKIKKVQDLVNTVKNQKLTSEIQTCREKCTNCKHEPTIHFKILEDNGIGIVLSKIQAELFKHGHSRTKKNSQTKKNRSKKEACLELLNHYNKFHS